MSNHAAELAGEATLASNPLDVIPNEMPFDVPYGRPISLEQTRAVIHAAVAEPRKHDWKMNVAVADSGGNLVAFERMDGAMLASVQIAQHKARAAVMFRRPTSNQPYPIRLNHDSQMHNKEGLGAARLPKPRMDASPQQAARTSISGS